MRWFIIFMLCLPFNLQANSIGNLESLLNWMQGGFTSEAQSKRDESFFNIHLYMKRIWAEENQGYWLYVEQSAASRLEQPYRQRVYHLTELPDGRFKSEVFTFENSMEYAGNWKLDKPLGNLTPSDLIVREGCAVLLEWNESTDAFEGSTEDKKCSSSLRGASYATSRVFVFADRIESWDQGFDSNDEQVWGSVKAGYIFQRVD